MQWKTLATALADTETLAKVLKEVNGKTCSSGIVKLFSSVFRHQ
jgi:hypothetical protein